MNAPTAPKPPKKELKGLEKDVWQALNTIDLYGANSIQAINAIEKIIPSNDVGKMLANGNEMAAILQAISEVVKGCPELKDVALAFVVTTFVGGQVKWKEDGKEKSEFQKGPLSDLFKELLGNKDKAKEAEAAKEPAKAPPSPGRGI